MNNTICRVSIRCYLINGYPNDILGNMLFISIFNAYPNNDTLIITIIHSYVIGVFVMPKYATVEQIFVIHQILAFNFQVWCSLFQYSVFSMNIIGTSRKLNTSRTHLCNFLFFLFHFLLPFSFIEPKQLTLPFFKI